MKARLIHAKANAAPLKRVAGGDPPRDAADTRGLPPAADGRSCKRTCPAVRAFSLIEMAVALSITSLLLVAIGSAMVLTSRAVPDGTGSASAAVEVSEALARLSGELQYARYVAERTPRAITFTVADRTGNGSPERIRYEWSGESGDPLTRQLNDQDAVAVIAALDAFTLTYHTHDASHAYPGPPVEGAEQELARSPSGDSAEASVATSQSLGQFIVPDVSHEAVGWRPTRVEFRARRPWLSSGSFHVQLRRAALDNTPDEPASERLLVQQTLSVDLLSLSLSWREATFSNAPLIAPGIPVTLAFVHNDGSSPIAHLEYRQNTSVGGLSTDGGDGNWTYYAQHTLRHRLFGRVTAPGPDQQFDRRFLRAVDIDLQTPGLADAAAAAEVELTNRPEILHGFWRADFHHDPTTLDVNADAQPDWVASESFDPASLSHGVWHADRTLAAYPTGPMTTPVRARLRMRHAQSDGGAALVWLYFDRAGGTIGNLVPMLQRQSNGTQWLLLYSRRDDDSWNLLAHVDDLPGDEFVDVRLLVDPGHETAHLQVNGLDHGTHLYEQRSSSSGNGLFAIGHVGSNVRFDYVELTVSESP